MELTNNECSQYYGQASGSNLMVYFLIGCGVIAVLKLLFSRRGRISIAGIVLQWGK